MIDPEIQRYFLNLKKVERIVRDFSPEAMDVITLSRRDPVTLVILDGWHRVQAVKELTDTRGTILARVFTGLTRAEEAMLFLRLNSGNQPNLLEKFKARLVANEESARVITETAHSYGWSISPITANGNIQCVGTLDRIYQRSLELEADPNLLQLAIMTATRAFGQEREGVQSGILEGLAILFAEYGEQVKLDRLVQKLKAYGGGPIELSSNAHKLSSIERSRLPVAVVSLLVTEYNKGLQSNRLAPPRKKRL